MRRLHTLKISAVICLLCLGFFLSKAPAASATSVVIQAGHGGSDPGAIGYDGTYESTINLAIAQKLNALLTRHGVQTIMTRTDDTDQDPDANMAMANSRGADAYIDIHNEGSDNADDSGDEMWFAPKSAADFKFATVVHASVMQAIRTYGYTDVIDGGLTQADPSDNWMIERAKMPALIIECLYVSNEREEQLVQTDSFQQALARGIYDGIAEYFGLQKENTRQPTVPRPARARTAVADQIAKHSSNGSLWYALGATLSKNGFLLAASLCFLGIMGTASYFVVKRYGRPGKKKRTLTRGYKGRHRK